jgi:MFS transporter, FHS family, glucose/mannose:H+ symporter
MYKKNLVFAAACIGMLLFGIVFLSLGAIFTFIKTKFMVDAITAGSLASSLPFGMLAGSIFFGPIVDRFGYKKFMIVCSALVFIGIEAIAMANVFFILQISFFIIGVAGGGLNGGTNALAADISSEFKGASLSLLGVFFGIGAISMPAVLGLLSKTFSYETIISGIGFFVLIPLVYFCIIAFPVPKQAQGFPIKQSLSLIKDSTLLLLGFILFFESGVEGIVGNWTTSFLKGSLNISEANALFVLSSQVIALTLTRLILGSALKKMKPATVQYICYAFILAGGITMYVASSFVMAVIALVLIGIGFAAGFPVILGFVAELYSNLSGTAFSIALAIALIGNTLINFFVGAVGAQKLPLILIISALIMSLLLSISIKRISVRIKS